MTWNCILERIATTQSTNDDLLVRWRAGELIDPVARIAREQTAGKGRMGRTWVSEPEDTLCFSLAYPFSCRPQELSGLSLVAGLAVIAGLAVALNTTESALFDQGLRLKWPNDLLLNNAKLGGILIEGGQANLDSPSWMILGIGLNLKDAQVLQVKLGSDAAYGVAALDQLIPHGQNLADTECIWLTLLESFEKHLTVFKQYGFSHFKEAWEQWDAFVGQAVCISSAQTENICGIASGIDLSGAMIISHDNQNILVHAGDVSLRAQS